MRQMKHNSLFGSYCIPSEADLVGRSDHTTPYYNDALYSSSSGKSSSQSIKIKHREEISYDR